VKDQSVLSMHFIFTIYIKWENHLFLYIRILKDIYN